jgi:hypothetical protein
VFAVDRLAKIPILQRRSDQQVDVAAEERLQLIPKFEPPPAASYRRLTRYFAQSDLSSSTFPATSCGSAVM